MNKKAAEEAYDKAIAPAIKAFAKVIEEARDES